MPIPSKLAIGRARFRFAAVLVSLGVLAGCGGAGTSVPVQPAVPLQGGAAGTQSVALRPLQSSSAAQHTSQLVFQPETMHESQVQVTPVKSQVAPQTGRRTASIGWAGNVTTAANSNNLGITSGPDGNVWFCENNVGTSGKIGMVTPAGVLSEFSVPSIVYNNRTYYFHPLFITSLAGKLWFTSGGAVVSLTTSGAFTFYYLASGGQITIENFSSIVAGTDGNLWTLDYASPNKLWRITTGGSFASAALTSNALQYGSAGLVNGPDGNLWFTEYNNNAVAKATTAGFVTEYATGLPTSNPIGIASGPDGNLWFTQKSTSGTSGYLMYMTTGGVLSGYNLPHAPGVIASARGSLWYLASGPVVWQFTPGGTTLYPYSLPAGSATGVWITTGPDLNLYFTGGGTGGNVVTKFFTQ